MIATGPSLRYLNTFFLSLPALLYFVLLPTAFASPSDIDKGKEIFTAKCTPCHTIGGGRKVGPDLRGVTNAHPKTWLFSFIFSPDNLFSANDPAATALLKEYQMKMPNPGLSADEVNAVIGYLEMQATAAPQAKAAAPAQVEAKGSARAADGERGEGYFSGRIAFKNNGPPCMACHNASRIKYPGGGTLGPDLTGVYAQMGEGIVPLLVNVPFPTMKPIFDSHPLSEDEARDIAVFLKGTASRHAEDHTTQIVMSSFLAFVIIMVIIFVLWRNRLKSVRKAMVKRAKQEADSR
jgi:mono/diheme cytochrome c family protein